MFPYVSLSLVAIPAPSFGAIAVLFVVNVNLLSYPLRPPSFTLLVIVAF